jgi:hypothetical protein
MATMTFPQLAPFNLPSLCEKLGIPLHHHVATSDALAAARLFIDFVEREPFVDWRNCEYSLQDWIPASDRELRDWDDSSPSYIAINGANSNRTYEEPVDTQRRAELTRKAHEFLALARLHAEPVLGGWAFAMTGTQVLGKGQRKPTIEILRKLGAKCGPRGQVLKRDGGGCGPTNAIIVSEEELCELATKPEPKGKLAEVLELRAEGESIVLLTEEGLYDLAIQAVRTGTSIRRTGYLEEAAASFLWRRLEEVT